VTVPEATSDAGGARAQRWLRAHAAPGRRLINIGLCFGIAHAAVACLIAWLVAQALARVIFHRAGYGDLWTVLALIGIFALLRGALLYQQRLFSDRAAHAAICAMHRQLRESLRALGPSWCASQSQGDLITRLVEGVDTFAPFYANYLPQTVFAVIVPLVVAIAVSVADPWSAVALAACAPLIPIFMILAGRSAADASTRRWLVLRRLGSQFMDAIAGLTTLLLYRAGDREHKRLTLVGDAYRRETMAVLRVAFLSSLVMEFFAAVSIAVVAVMVGFRLMDGRLAFENGLFALLLAPEFFAPLRALGTQRHTRMEALAAADGLIDIVEQARAHATGDTASAMPGFAPPAIRLQSVRAGYERDVLHGIDLDIPAGTRLTVVGASGGGKSTLLALLMGFIAVREGRVEIDGQHLSALRLDAWRRQITWMPQRPHVFRGSLRDNLRIARPDAGDAALARAIQHAALDKVIARLPQGLDTPLGERGYGLSGGEAQRLALARAWLRDTPIMLLDEPTQHLDATTAGAIDDALDALCADRTVIRIAHRVDTLSDDERIAVLNEGRIVEVGTVATLRRQEGAFSALLRLGASA